MKEGAGGLTRRSLVRYGVGGLAIILLAGACASAPRDVTGSVARLSGEVCRRDIIGGAVVIGDGLVLTVAHVIAGADEDLSVVTPDGSRHEVAVVGFDSQVDLALLAAADLEAPPLALESAEPNDRGRIVAVGRDLEVREIEYTVKRRVVARSTDIYDEGRIERVALDIEALIEPGVSGAPLVDDRGSVVGVVFADARDEAPAAFAIDASEIRTFLDGVDPATTVDAGRCR